jgi:NAD(P)H-nitrite reductase large subunit
VHREGRIEALLFVGPSPKLPSPEWLKSQFDRADMTVTDRRALLAGIPFEGAVDEGAIVCVCFQVGAARIAAVAGAGGRSVESIGRQLGAGTNCGSCIPEIRRLIGGIGGPSGSKTPARSFRMPTDGTFCCGCAFAVPSEASGATAACHGTSL